jgi:hypothetical protein
MLVREFQIYRKIMSWVFAFISVVCLWIALLCIITTIRYYRLILPETGLAVPAIFLVLATFFGVAWWTVWEEKPSAKKWGIAASLINNLVMLCEIIRHSRSSWSRAGVLLSRAGVLLAIGIVGLIAFLWPDKEESEIYDTETCEVETDDTEQCNNNS